MFKDLKKKNWYYSRELPYFKMLALKNSWILIRFKRNASWEGQLIQI